MNKTPCSHMRPSKDGGCLTYPCVLSGSISDFIGQCPCVRTEVQLIIAIVADSAAAGRPGGR